MEIVLSLGVEAPVLFAHLFELAIELIDALHALSKHQFEPGSVSRFIGEVAAQLDDDGFKRVDFVFQRGDIGARAPAVAQMHGSGC